MKKQISNKLYAFIIAMMFISVTNAQIIYTDVNPDSTVTRTTLGTNTYSLDINNDGIVDFNINALRTFGCGGMFHLYSKVSVKTLGSNQIAIKDTIGSGYDNPALALNLNDIEQYQIWDTTGSANGILLSNAVCYKGVWSPATDKYLGIKLISGGNAYYGWIRLQVSMASSIPSFILKDYAYNSIPNQPIHAGETSCTTSTVSLAASGPLSFCNGDSVVFTVNGTGYLYQWKKNNINISGATNKTYTAKTAGVYKCKVTNSCGSKTTGTRTVTIPCRLTNEVFTDHLENPYELKVSPNPFSNSTTISFSIEQPEKVSLKIFDLNGRLIELLADNFFEEGEHSAVWNVEKVNEGIYFMQLQAADYSKTEKLIVTK